MTKGGPDVAWIEGNQRYLSAALRCVEQLLLRGNGGVTPHAGPLPSKEEGSGSASEIEGVQRERERARAALSTPPALELLGVEFDLSPFERDLLLLCAGVELEGRFAERVAKRQGAPSRTAPTFSLALSILPGSHWSALAPGGPLRRWHLLDVPADQGLLWAPLRIDERVLHYLTGVSTLDERLATLVEPVRVPEALVPSHQRLAEELADTWRVAGGLSSCPVVQLLGPDAADREAAAASACAALGLQLHRLHAHMLPTAPAELDGLLRLWERDATLERSALLVNCARLGAEDTPRRTAVEWLVERVWGGVLVSDAERTLTLRRSARTFRVPRPGPDEQGALWGRVLDGEITDADPLVAQFDLGAEAIRTLTLGDERASLETLWQRCRTHVRPRLDQLAQRVETGALWDDLVLPEEQAGVLRALLAAVRQRATVYQRWGFGREARGRGVSALFSGPSGTGKTLAAELLARELHLDLYRVDLSQVVNKYVGETEKNLKRVFDAAEEGGVVLLFDEADALFGKRSEVKDSHDRFANIEISYLLQRMEAYRGLAILTTNMPSALDSAFLRRLRFVVQFPFPDASQRRELWRKVFPAAAPTGALDFDKLARLNVSGGAIRSIALGAAFLAAEEGSAVGMRHLREATRIDSLKTGRPLVETEIGGWA